MKVVVSANALSDLARLRRFLSDQPAALSKASMLLANAIESLGEFADRGRIAGKAGLRERIVRFGSSAYVIRHATAVDRVIVLRVWHGREDRPSGT